MLKVLDPTYTFRVEVKDRMVQPGQMVQSIPPPSPHKFFDGLNGKTGCDEVLAAVKNALAKAGLDCWVSLEKFEHS